jgi:hypothetical protein
MATECRNPEALVAISASAHTAIKIVCLLLDCMYSLRAFVAVCQSLAELDVPTDTAKHRELLYRFILLEFL